MFSRLNDINSLPGAHDSQAPKNMWSCSKRTHFPIDRGPSRQEEFHAFVRSEMHTSFHKLSREGKPRVLVDGEGNSWFMQIAFSTCRRPESHHLKGLEQWRVQHSQVP